MTKPIFEHADFNKIIDAYADAAGWKDHGFSAPEVKWRRLGEKIADLRAELTRVLEQRGDNKRTRRLSSEQTRLWEENKTLRAALEQARSTLPSMPHPAGALESVIAEYADGSRQTTDGEVYVRARAAIDKALNE